MCDIQEAPARVKDMMDKIRKPSGSDRFEKYELQLSQDFELIDETKILKVHSPEYVKMSVRM